MLGQHRAETGTLKIKEASAHTIKKKYTNVRIISLEARFVLLKHIRALLCYKHFRKH